MPDFCPKGIDLGVKPLAPSCLLLCPRTWGPKLGKLEVRELPPPPQEGLPWSQ